MIYFFVLPIALMLSRISVRHLCKSNKHNYKTFTKSPPASLLHCIQNILNHSSGKCCDSLTVVALSFAKSTGISTIFIHQYLLDNSVMISSKNDDTDASLSFGTAKDFVNLITKKNNCVSFNFKKLLPFSEL